MSALFGKETKTSRHAFSTLENSLSNMLYVIEAKRKINQLIIPRITFNLTLITEFHYLHLKLCDSVYDFTVY